MDIAAIFLPLAGFLIAGLFGRLIGDRASMAVTTLGVCVSAVISWWLFFDVAIGGHERTHSLLLWIHSGTFVADWALKFDTLTAVMLIVVNTVSAMVHVYSIGYMSHDHSKPRFFAYLSLFTFAMLMLVTADNLVQLFFGWEGVGLASYLLIGFWHEKESARAAAVKAFLVNRVGDFGFALGIFAVYKITGTVRYEEIFAAAPHLVDARINFLGMDLPALTTASLLLFVGAMGKSAQLGLHTWLPDAMEGPTPVSALIHAATMVTAGVFMLARMSPLFEYAPDALAVVCVIGALTAFVAATIGLTQWDIKRVIAYSTMSQLGYMFFAIGVSAYQAAIFHLMTHAFFKALLFLGAGSVIHAMGGEQDMRKMGGIWKLIPSTYAMMWIGSLALAGVGIPGVFGFAGFYSKDMILEAAWSAHTGVGVFAYWLGVIAALMTAFYSGRLLFLTFHGKPRADHHTMEHAHESPPVMLIPLIVLSVGAVLAGIIGYEVFVGEGREGFWREAILVLHGHDSIEAAHHSPEWVGLLPLFAGLVGLALSWLFYIKMPSLPGAIAGAFKPLYQLFFRKWYFDEIYDALFVKPAFVIGRALWKGGDGAIIDRLGPDGIAATSVGIARKASRFESGYVYHYAFVMVIGVVALVSWYVFAGRM
ncbi:NADH-quinone oxidoreductase subunit L [Inquilinus ginsengisoli]|uniref:NADH-quinone oxidoreductase subunit L n=1 Tax=Inquilinus ginsengisoli TaxID=363840 RepID=A0ABU1JRT2_9PROT|nr:NADH-quinone oxidoreductase subunit L [Inquilinus ginsengisoli]MDR6291307.1 NADH-quinone oxidoreductase subunit L [Inquilinus ginsengisoli]